MSRVRFYTALLSAKLTYLAIKILNKSSGTSFVGMLTLKICPEFLSYCRNYIKQGKNSVTVTGTNGKTTTSGLLARILEGRDKKVLHNLKGANMLTGIANVFALKIKPFGKKFDYAVIESDEAYLTKLYDFYKSDYLIVTNLFRDQLDRYGELATTAGYIRNAIEKSSDTLVLNADDPLVTNLGSNLPDRKIVFYGMENVEFCEESRHSETNAPSEVYNCVCGKPLVYDKHFIAQEGHYHCNSCGYKRPEPDYKGYVKIYKDYSELTVVSSTGSYTFKINLIGLYNAYNALAALACALEQKISPEIIQQALQSYHAIFGRAERRVINGHDTLIQLIKNPTGASEVLKTVDLKSNIIVAINDNYADGRDISWLWDSDFEQLRNAEGLVIASGCRANDTALRLKYAGISQEKIIVEENIKNAIIAASKEDNNDRITILPSYTALLKINKMKF